MVSYHPRGTVSNVWRQFLVVTGVGVSAKGLRWVEARDAALYPPVHQTPLHQTVIQPQTSQHWVEQPGAISGAGGPPNQPRTRKSVTSRKCLCQDPLSSCPTPTKETCVAAELSRKSLMGMLKESEVPHIAAVNRDLSRWQVSTSSWPGSYPSTASWKELG